MTFAKTCWLVLCLSVLHMGWSSSATASLTRVGPHVAVSSGSSIYAGGQQSKQLYAQANDGVVRVEARELVLHVDRFEATAALEVQNLAQGIRSMGVASLMLGACQTQNDSFRGLALLQYKTPSDVFKFTKSDLRQVAPGEKFILSVRTGTSDPTCRTLAETQEVDVSLDLWLFDGKEGVRLPLRVPVRLRVVK